MNGSFISAASIALEKVVAYPSPARTFTRIRYTLSDSAESVSVKIYDSAGRRVRNLEGAGLGVGVNTCFVGSDEQ